MKVFAHSRENDPDLARWQGLEEHLLQTAEKAGMFATAFGARDWGYLAGLWGQINEIAETPHFFQDSRQLIRERLYQQKKGRDTLVSRFPACTSVNTFQSTLPRRKRLAERLYENVLDFSTK